VANAHEHSGLVSMS